MRRNDREITDSRAIELFISNQQIMRIGFCDGGEVYIVPVNFGYKIENGKYTFYFHGASAGRKYTLAQSKPRVGFELDGEYSLLTADKACGYSAKYQSVIGSGTLSVVRNREEKIMALNCLMKQLTGNSCFSYEEAALSATAVFKIEADRLSCKAKGDR